VTQPTRVALFIDAENASPKHLSECVAYCATLGRLTIKRCYGHAAALEKWASRMAEHHITPVMTPPAANGKANASDFALIIDAVSLLHRDRFDCAVIVSSDADFIQLAGHIRDHGKAVFGFGDNKGSDQLKSAFDGYQVAEAAASKSPAKPPPVTPVAAAAKIPAAELAAHFRACSGETRDVSIQLFGSYLAKRMPAGYRKGHGTLSNYLKKSGVFDVSSENRVTLRGH